jgi:MFS family permease
VETPKKSRADLRKPSLFYGWYIVGVGVLSNIASVFSFSSTLSVFLTPITGDLGVSRGSFSLVRTGEILVSSLIVPFIGPVIDRHGGRGMIATGAVIASAGYFLLSQVQHFWQFLFLSCTVVVLGDTLMNSLVSVILSRWFIRKRGRVIAIASLGTGIAKVSMPLFATSLFVWVGWRHTWTVFAILTLALVVAPALALLRRSPEDMGLLPDGEPAARVPGSAGETGGKLSAAQRQALAADVPWSRREVLRTQAFWLLVVSFGIVSVGIAGLNLHMYAFVTDAGSPPMIAAT